MKKTIGLAISFGASCALALMAIAGPESVPSDNKEMKQVAPAPLPECDWTGFYFGLHLGGQFGHAEDKDLDDYDVPDRPWGYPESGVIAGGQIGYNWQWHRLVLGPEFDLGYLNLDGSGVEPGSPGNNTVGKSDSDFYTTFRGRIGVNLDWHGCWLIYATGGGIGVDLETKVIDNCDTGPCGPGTIDAHENDFAWGYTVGGGLERQIGRHWSLKTEYLFYDLGDRTFSGVNSADGLNYRWRSDNQGHIIRAGLNFRF